jgi:hypothetical protein
MADDSGSGLSRTARIVGTVVAPTTLVTALLFYFGWSHAYWFFEYFGVDSSLLGLTTRDYLMRSLDGLFVPMVVVACAGLAAVWAHSLLNIGTRTRLLPVLIPIVGGVGAFLALIGLARVFGVRTPLDTFVSAVPLCLAVGVLLVAYAVYLWRLFRPAPRTQWRTMGEWLGVFVLVGLALFWAASDYSAAVGRSRAAEFVARMPAYPTALVYSEKSLSLDIPGVVETRCADPDAAYRYRYAGLKLLLQSGNQYVMVPSSWTTSRGVAILLPRNDSLRLELLPASPDRAPIPTTC